ncbi:hypothetical protein EV2_043034 [Malus domestica]
MHLHDVTGCHVLHVHHLRDAGPRFWGSPCCNAMASLKVIADTIENRRFARRCLMALIATNNPNVPMSSPLCLSNLVEMPPP